MRINLENQIALVTGAARGIGKAIADAFAANGARVLYTDIDLATATESAAQSGRGQALALDVTDAAQVEAVMDRVVRECGRLDILVNNAGVNTLEHRVTIDQFPPHEWDRILGVDLHGLFLVSRAGARVMLPQKSGRIINIASVAGLVPLRLQCPFVAAKAGVINLTKAMALELGPRGILVNGIAPGSVLTEGTRKLFYGEDGKFKDAVQRLLDHIPLGRPGTPEEIAHAALFLAAPESSYVNGHILTVDGGWTAGYTRDF
jgi:3-oxoacyl-[acyl-carrier protein] reductase